MGREVRFWVVSVAGLLAATSMGACGDENPGALVHDGGSTIDLGTPPDAAVVDMDASVLDSGTTDGGAVAYCGRVGSVQNLAHFALPRARRVAVVSDDSSLGAVFAATRGDADYIVRQSFSASDGTLVGAEKIVTPLSFGSYFYPAAAASPIGGVCTFDSQADGTRRVTTLQRIDVSGDVVGDPVRISDPTFPSPRSWAAAVGAGEFATAWTESTLGSLPDGTPAYAETRLRFAHVGSDGALFDDVIDVPTDGRIESVAMARGASDSALVYVLQRDTSDSSSDTIFVRPIGADGSLSTSPVMLVELRDVLGDVSAIRVTENTVVAWTELTAGLRPDIHVMRIGDDGTLAVERIVTRGTEQGSTPAISLFGAFHVALAYVGGPSGTHDLRFLEFEIDDLPLRDAVSIADLDDDASFVLEMNSTFTRGTLGIGWSSTSHAGNNAHFAVVGCNVAGEDLDGGWCEPDAGM